MGSVNLAVIVGKLGKEVEVRYIKSGSAVANFSVATESVWTDTQGQKQKKTQWHQIVVWGKQAESCGQYLHRGSQVYIEGSIETREWLDKEGKKNWKTEIIAKQVAFLDGKQGSGAGPSGPPPPDDDVPHGNPSEGEIAF